MAIAVAWRLTPSQFTRCLQNCPVIPIGESKTRGAQLIRLVPHIPDRTGSLSANVDGECGCNPEPETSGVLNCPAIIYKQNTGATFLSNTDYFTFAVL